MFKKWSICILMMAFICSLIGCRGHLRQDVMIFGEVHEYSNRSVKLSLTSTLPKDSIIHITLREIGSDNIVWEGNTTFTKDGFLTYEFKRPKINQEYKIEVLFEPTMQPAAIKEMYGESGEYIRDDSPGYHSYASTEKEMGRIIMYGVITGFKEETKDRGHHASSNLESDFANLERMLD